MLKVRVVCLALLLSALLATGLSTPASATTTRTVSGRVLCAYGHQVVGIWVSSSAGGSHWANSWTRNSTYKNVATFTAKITTSASSTKIRLDIGCGGTSKTWWSNNSTPSFTVAGSKAVYASCKEASGTRAQRCGVTTTKPCATAGGIAYTITWAESRRAVPGVYQPTNGPGGTVTATKKESGTVTRSVGAGLEAEVGVVYAKVKANVQTAIEKSYTSSTEVGYTRTIPNGRIGTLTWSNWGVLSKMRKYRVSSTCNSTTTLKSGAMWFPSTKVGWYYSDKPAS